MEGRGRQHYELDLRTWVFLLIHIEFSTTGITGIQKERKIKAKDKGSVFTVMAKGRMTKGSSIDIEKRRGIKEGEESILLSLMLHPAK